MPTAVGAPAQRSQGSRKSKRAWRKNVGIDAVEECLETLRAEERVTGGPVHSKSNDQLFEVDDRGDETIRQRLPKVSLKSLKSIAILSQRSAVPAVKSRRKHIISHEERRRMWKAGRRRESGLMDVQSIQVNVNNETLPDAYGMWDGSDTHAMRLKGTCVKTPSSLRPHTTIAIAPVTQPHEGTSYNPPLLSHQALLHSAHETEERRIAEEGKYKELKAKMNAARRDANEEGLVNGMKIDINDHQSLRSEAEAAEKDGDSSSRRGAPKPKTNKQRRKAAVLLAEKRAKLTLSARQKQLESITRKNLRALRLLRPASSIEKKRRSDLPQALTAEELSEKKKRKLRLGKHILPIERIDVQLGEELSESFRELKPEGNLFRDRFESMQRRALVEPRTRVLPKKVKMKDKDYEKHAWKRFN